MLRFETKFIGLAIILIIVLIISTLNFENPDKIETLRCNWSSEMQMKSFEGLLESKFKDRSNHNKETLLIRSPKQEYRITLTNEKNDIFEELEIGDFVKKEKGSLKISVVRDKQEKVYILDYGCKQ